VCEIISCYGTSHIIQLCSQSLVHVSNTSRLIRQKCGSDQSKTAELFSQMILAILIYRKHIYSLELCLA